ncbi:MAG: sugar:proton symporter [Chlamydiales bacterium]|nr:sugar:proton symporter [Chlamydiales bacterium]
MENNKQKYLYACSYILLYMAFSFAMTQFTPFLSKLGYDSMQRGILLSSYAFTTIVFQMLFGFLCDKYSSVKKFVVAALMIYAVSTYLFYSRETQFFVYHVIVIAFSGGLINTTCGLCDAWVLGADKNLRKNLPFIKTFGSIGWATGSIILSSVISRFGYSGVSNGILILCILSLGLLHFIKDVDRHKDKNTEKAGLADVKELILNKRYSLLVFILFLMYCVIITNNTAVVDKMLALGATNLEIGYKWSIQSMIEIPTYLFGSYFLRKFNHYFLLKVSALALTVQFVLLGMSSSITQIIILSAFQMLTTPLVMITSQTLIYELASEKMKATGQLFALSIFIGVSSLLVPTGAGVMTRYFNPSTTLFTAAALAALAFVLIDVLKKGVVKE